EEVVKASGLSLGQPVSIEELDRAAGRLMATGLFSDLTYTVRQTGGAEVTVVFKVVEQRGKIPVVFDNFVWFTDDELAQAVRRQVPSFDGTAPETDGAVESIRKALEALLRERGVAGEVEHTPSADLAGRNPEHIFSVKTSLPVCSVRYPGASALAEAELLRHSKGLFENPYSRKFAGGFVSSNLGPLYRERGHLKVKFADPQAKPESAGGCKGVQLVVPIEEGAVYSWEGSTWEGNRALAAGELDAALAMRVGELANGLKIDKGFAAARKAYGRKGYLFPRFKTQTAFDDAARRVAFRVGVEEGAQFRMGAFAVKGLTDSDAERVRKSWRLAPGAVYDASYFDEFVRRELRDALGARRGPGSGLKADIRPDRERQTVDVTLEFR
ncbi:MAG TPA: POTRA domain-containing protein, partial [Pyrinomonadaceae bacterium]|nr:POTRA domain-containing protein [Pyrinomonadaceae bacterium]